MDLTEIATLVDYLVWTRGRVLSAASHLTPSAFVEADTITTRDLRGTLVHQLENEWAWRVRLRDGAFPAGDLDPLDFPDIYALARRWRHEEAELRAWLRTLTDERLRLAPAGEGDDLPLWQYLVHVVTHGVAQFTEAAVLLTHLGHSPGELGFLEYAATARPAGRRSNGTGVQPRVVSPGR